jgi:hypothetical protein
VDESSKFSGRERVADLIAEEADESSRPFTGASASPTHRWEQFTGASASMIALPMCGRIIDNFSGASATSMSLLNTDASSSTLPDAQVGQDETCICTCQSSENKRQGF